MQLKPCIPYTSYKSEPEKRSKYLCNRYTNVTCWHKNKNINVTDYYYFKIYYLKFSKNCRKKPLKIHLKRTKTQLLSDYSQKRRDAPYYHDTNQILRTDSKNTRNCFKTQTLASLMSAFKRLSKHLRKTIFLMNSSQPLRPKSHGVENRLDLWFNLISRQSFLYIKLRLSFTA